jgi:predicted nucleotidyltransferase
MSVAELPIQIDREKIGEFCRGRGIRKLSLFGSVLRDDFDPARSDVDVLAARPVAALKTSTFPACGHLNQHNRFPPGGATVSRFFPPPTVAFRQASSNAPGPEPRNLFPQSAKNRVQSCAACSTRTTMIVSCHGW